jgi:SAM-dependent methyltransferase
MYEEYIAAFLPRLRSFASGRPPLVSVELGAGTCLMSLLLSRTGLFGEMHCSDVSGPLMHELSSQSAPVVGADHSILKIDEFDLSSPFPYAAGSCDLVMFDASMHHSQNLWLTLRECHRVLKPDGLLIAQREQYMAALTSGIAIRNLLRTEEVRSGVSENIYSRSQYEYYLRACGFRPEFLPVAPGKFRFFPFLNGLVFSKWVIVASPQANAPVLD